MVLDHHIGLVRLGLFSGNGPVRLVLVLSIGPCLVCLLFLVCDIEPYIKPVRLVLVSGICHSIGLVSSWSYWTSVTGSSWSYWTSLTGYSWSYWISEAGFSWRYWTCEAGSRVGSIGPYAEVFW